MPAGPPVRSRTFWVLVALTGATRLAVVLADHRSLIAGDVFPDDAFYYLRIAANVVAGRGLTFDGAAPTNGFHPLYFLMLLPIVAAARGNLILPIHLAGALLSAWAVATAFVLYALLRRLATSGVALFGLLLWAVCPYFILMSVNGLETGLAIFFGLLVPLLYLAWFHGERRPDAPRALAFGAVCGGAVLARLDLVLIVTAVAVVEVARQIRARRPDARSAALALATGAAVWLPWGLVSHAATGHWLPLSGAASREIALNFGWLNLNPIWTHPSAQQRLFDPAHVPASYTLDVATKLGVTFLFENPLLAPLRANVAVGPWSELAGFVPYRMLLVNPGLAVGVALVAAAAMAVVWKRRARALPPDATAAGRAALRRIIGVYLPLVWIGYSCYSPTHWYFNRYLAGPIALTTVSLLAEAAPFAAWPSRARTVLAVVALAIAGCQVAQWRFFTRLRWSAAPTGGFLASWRSLEPRVPPGARIGAFQAGTYGWFGGRDVINLDGKVNQDAFTALKERRLHEYIRSQGVRYVMDGKWMLHVLCARHAPPGSVSFHAIAQAAGDDGVQLFEVVDGR
jgi:hypothetical protein